MNRAKLLANPRLAGQVLRYHTWPVHRQQSVGEHTWQVLRIYFQIFGAPGPLVTSSILWHDAGELVTGDLPFPFKAHNATVKDAIESAEYAAIATMGGVPDAGLSDDQRRRVKTCDLIDMLEFGLHELGMGNRFAYPIVDDISESIRKLWYADGKPPESATWQTVQRYLERLDWSGSDRSWR
jgi:hypothetical protein